MFAFAFACGPTAPTPAHADAPAAHPGEDPPSSADTRRGEDTSPGAAVFDVVARDGGFVLPGELLAAVPGVRAALPDRASGLAFILSGGVPGADAAPFVTWEFYFELAADGLCARLRDAGFEDARDVDDDDTLNLQRGSTQARIRYFEGLGTKLTIHLADGEGRSGHHARVAALFRHLPPSEMNPLWTEVEAKVRGVVLTWKEPERGATRPILAVRADRLTDAELRRLRDELLRLGLVDAETSKLGISLRMLDDNYEGCLGGRAVAVALSREGGQGSLQVLMHAGDPFGACSGGE